MAIESAKNIIKKFIFILILNTIGFYIMFKLSIFVANNLNFNNLIISRDINGINYVIGFLSIFCCFLYYYLYEDDYFYMFSLTYISIYLEFLIGDILMQKLNIIGLLAFNPNFIGFASIFRTILLYLAIFNKNKVNRYLNKHRIIGIAIVAFITFLCIKMDLMVIQDNLHIINQPIIDLLKSIINIVTYLLLIEVSRKYFNEKNFNYLITVMSLNVMFLSRLLLVVDLYKDEYRMYSLNRIMLAIGFIIIIISLFLEIIIKYKKNRELTYEVFSQKNQMDKLKEEEEIRTQFFANISHELRTPLNIINSTFQLLKMHDLDKEEFFKYYRKYENTISQNCSRMLRLINNIIDINKFDGGYFKMNFINCEIISLIENVTLSIAECEKAKERNIIFDTDTEVAEIRCDPESIERLILNLLSNAIKFTEDSGNIIVKVKEEKDYLVIIVKDDGIGIPKEFNKRIFERFVQVDKSFRRNAEGSGIGLSLVKSIVDSHNGEIYLKDSDEKGCEFIIKLPNVKDHLEYNDSSSETNKYNQFLKEEINNKIFLEFSDIE